MCNNDGSAARPRHDASFIRLDVENGDWRQAALLLEAAGGRPISGAEGAVYRFLTDVEREQALDLVRYRFGGTIATASDGVP